ncbi:unnamed protein product, partial [Mesorhabditis belari]|uniref:BTB domain-containing protein n=1 Tax=Mesorhabditis belari TaxID=2138241 RepID=A0AAF3FCJ2_9BILA
MDTNRSLPDNTPKKHLTLKVDNYEKHLLSIGQYLIGQRAIGDDNNSYDLELIFNDGHSELCHSVVLAAHSQKIAKILKDEDLDNIRVFWDESSMIVPLLDFVYTGKFEIDVHKIPALIRLSSCIGVSALVSILGDKLAEVSNESAKMNLIAIDAAFDPNTFPNMRIENLSLIASHFLKHSFALSASEIANLPDEFVKFLVSTKHFTTSEKLTAINIALLWLNSDGGVNAQRSDIICQNAQFASFEDGSNLLFRQDLYQCLQKYGSQLFVGRDETGAVYVSKADPLALQPDLIPSIQNFQQAIKTDQSISDSSLLPYQESRLQSLIEEMIEKTARLPDPFIEKVVPVIPYKEPVEEAAFPRDNAIATTASMYLEPNESIDQVKGELFGTKEHGAQMCKSELTFSEYFLSNENLSAATSEYCF